MARKYGIPYKGSKNAIARKIVDALPAGEVLVDLFAGGCAVADAAFESGKWKKVIINDINPAPTQLFVDALSGNLPDGREWISREAFFARKDAEPWIKYCYSFGNDGRTYLYGKNIEPFKHALHEAVFGDFDDIKHYFPTADYEPMEAAETPYERRLSWKKVLRESLNKQGLVEKRGGHWCKNNEYVDSLNSMERLNSLERLQSLEQLQSLERLNVDYREAGIPEGAVVYCDIPYKGTVIKQYLDSFDYDAFYTWARAHECYISEYSMPADFELVAEFDRYSHMSGAGDRQKHVKERLYYSNGKLKGE